MKRAVKSFEKFYDTDEITHHERMQDYKRKHPCLRFEDNEIDIENAKAKSSIETLISMKRNYKTAAIKNIKKQLIESDADSDISENDEVEFQHETLNKKKKTHKLTASERKIAGKAKNLEILKNTASKPNLKTKEKINIISVANLNPLAVECSNSKNQEASYHRSLASTSADTLNLQPQFDEIEIDDVNRIQVANRSVGTQTTSEFKYSENNEILKILSEIGVNVKELMRKKPTTSTGSANDFDRSLLPIYNCEQLDDFENIIKSNLKLKNGFVSIFSQLTVNLRKK